MLMSSASRGQRSRMRTAWASAASRFRRVEGATPVRRPRAVIVADDSLCFAVAECDVVGGQVASPSERGCPDGRQARVATGFMSGRSTHAQEVTQMPRTAPGSLSLETQDREKARPLHPSYS